MTEYRDPLSAASEGISQGLQIGTQRKQQYSLQLQQQLAVAKQKRDSLLQESDQYLKALQDKNTPPALFESIYNRYAALQYAIDPSIKLPMVKDMKPEDQELIKSIVYARIVNVPESTRKNLLADIINKAKPSDIAAAGQGTTLKHVLDAIDPRLTQTGNFQLTTTEDPTTGKTLQTKFDTSSGDITPTDFVRAYKPDTKPDVSGTMQQITTSGRVAPIGAPGQFAQRPNDETVKQFGDFNTLVEQLNTVKNTYKPEFVGVISGRVGKAKQLTGVGATEERSNFYSNLNSIRNQLIYLRSGKQINEQEYKRLLSELPDEDTSSKDFKPKLDNFDKVFTKLVENREKAFKETGHVVPSSKPPAPSFKVGESKQVGGFTIKRKK